ncbi:unnamed protein product [Knipowitschia caucasica]|uniref:Uncharacterized protein n=1 Tax=Knipowitschia caucasica TaxID=637954 RepID=A0AAV2JVW1_KNICA
MASSSPLLPLLRPSQLSTSAVAPPVEAGVSGSLFPGQIASSSPELPPHISGCCLLSWPVSLVPSFPDRSPLPPLYCLSSHPPQPSTSAGLASSLGRCFCFPPPPELMFSRGGPPPAALGGVSPRPRRSLCRLRLELTPADLVLFPGREPGRVALLASSPLFGHLFPDTRDKH